MIQEDPAARSTAHDALRSALTDYIFEDHLQSIICDECQPTKDTPEFAEERKKRRNLAIETGTQASTTKHCKTQQHTRAEEDSTDKFAMYKTFCKSVEIDFQRTPSHLSQAMAPLWEALGGPKDAETFQIIPDWEIHPLMIFAYLYLIDLAIQTSRRPHFSLAQRFCPQTIIRTSKKVIQLTVRC